MLSFELINLHRCWQHEQDTFYTYNRGQTSWNTFAFVGLSLNHTWPTFPPPPLPEPQTRLDRCIQNFSQISTLYRLGGGRTTRCFWKIALFYDGTCKLQKIISTALLSQGLFSWIADSATAESFMSEKRYIFIHFILLFFTIKTVPSENVALPSLGASVIEGVSRSRNALLNGEVGNYDWNIGYTCHQLGSGAIVVQLPQPYIIGSMRWETDAE